MVGTLSKITTLLLATSVLLIGHGLQLTLLPLHALSAGWSGTAIAWTGSSYFFGFVIGCLVLPKTISAVGHIRSFMVMAAVATVALLAAALFVEIGAWLLFRFATGFALAGLYMVIESWLTDISPPEQRGRVLSIYLFISLVGMAIGQLLIIVASVEDLQLFVLAAIMITIAIVPIGLTHIASPHPIPAAKVSLATLIHASRVAVIAAILTGMVVGSFWSLGPVVARHYGIEASSVGIVMSLGVIGGALAQVPVGRLSDSIDRRIVIGAVTLFGTAVSILAFLFAGDSETALLASFFLIGAASMPVYALCIAHASDRSDLNLVQIASGILLAHGAGSIIGPLIVAPLMPAGSGRVFFVFSAACLAVAAAFTFFRYFVVERALPHVTHSAMLPKTTQAIAELATQRVDSPAENGG